MHKVTRVRGARNKRIDRGSGDLEDLSALAALVCMKMEGVCTEIKIYCMASTSVCVWMMMTMIVVYG